MIANDGEQQPMTGSKSAILHNKNEQAPAPTDAPGDRFIWIRFDKAMPLRPQFATAKVVATESALSWLKRHPDDAPLRVGKKKNVTFYSECRRIDEAMRQGVPRDVIQRELWPTADRELARRRFNYRVARWRKLVAGRYLGPVATDQTSGDVVFPFASPVDRVR